MEEYELELGGRKVVLPKSMTCPKPVLDDAEDVPVPLPPKKQKRRRRKHRSRVRGKPANLFGLPATMCGPMPWDNLTTDLDAAGLFGLDDPPPVTGPQVPLTISSLIGLAGSIIFPMLLGRFGK